MGVNSSPPIGSPLQGRRPHRAADALRSGNVRTPSRTQRVRNLAGMLLMGGWQRPRVRLSDHRQEQGKPWAGSHRCRRRSAARPDSLNLARLAWAELQRRRFPVCSTAGKASTAAASIRWMGLSCRRNRAQIDLAPGALEGNSYWSVKVFAAAGRPDASGEPHRGEAARMHRSLRNSAMVVMAAGCLW